MKTISIFFFFIAMLLCVTNRSTNAQENKTPQQIRETQANYDGMIANIRTLAASAQEYYKKPASLKGGGNRFTGWVIPADIDTTANGTFTAKVEISKITIVGIGKFIGHDEKNNIRITAVIGPKTIVSLTMNN